MPYYLPKAIFGEEDKMNFKNKNTKINMGQKEPSNKVKSTKRGKCN